MLSGSFLLALAAVLSFFAPASLAQSGVSSEEIITLDTRPGVKQSFLLLQPEGDVKGVVVMFPGHEGVVHFVKEGSGYNVTHEGGGFSVRKVTRETFRKNGLVVALLAPPSDMEGGMNTSFRSSNEHLEDIRHVLAYLRERYEQKPYLHGHCRSTFSPASITTKLKNDGIAGIILSSPRSTGKHGAVMDYERGVISVPILLVQHKEDPCKGTPYSQLNNVKEFYEQSSRKVDAILVTGGDMKATGLRSCQAGPHSFKGLEQETSNAITDWILGKDYAREINGPTRHER